MLCLYWKGCLHFKLSAAPIVKRHTLLPMFDHDLKANGWQEIDAAWEYAKGNWKIDFDTGHWMIVSTQHSPRVFNVAVPGDVESRWIVKLIEHLCSMDDERHRLRAALARVRAQNDLAGAQAAASEALGDCYHSWLVNLAIAEGRMGRVYCTVCGRLGPSEILH